MLLFVFTLVFPFLLTTVVANTETYQFHVPEGLPKMRETYVPAISFIELWNTTLRTVQLEVQPQSISYVELIGLQNNNNYQVKVCWTAADPISISSIEHRIIPHDTDFLGVSCDQTRVILRIEIDSDSYPLFTNAASIDVSVAIVKLGIPVDLYSIILFIATVASISVLAARAVNPFGIFNGSKGNVNEPIKPN